MMTMVTRVTASVSNHSFLIVFLTRNGSRLFLFVKKKIPSKSWRECTKKVWEVDPLEFPRCGSEMKIISFIDERLLIQHILKYLNLWQERIPKGLPPPEDSIVETIVCEEFEDSWGGYSDLDVSMH